MTNRALLRAKVLAPEPLGGPEGELVNPFVPIPRWALVALLTVSGLYLLLVTAVALFNASEGNSSMLWVALSTLWLFFWLFYPLIFYRPEYGWCHPLILPTLLTLITLMPRNAGLFMNGMSEHAMLADWYPEELNMLLAYGHCVNSVALMAAYAGYFWGPRLRVPRVMVATTAPQRLYFVLLCALGVSVFAFYSYTQVFGGLQNHLKSLAYGMAQRIELAEGVDGIGQYTVLMSMAAVAALIWVCAQPAAFRNPVFWLVSTVALLMAYLSDGKRSSMIYPAMLMMLCWMLRHRHVPYLRLALVGVGAFFLLGVLGVFRTSNWVDPSELNVTTVRETSLAEIAVQTMEELTRRASSDSTFFPILAKVPREEELLYGRTYLEWGLRFIPREWWPDKPRGVDVQANLTFYGGEWGLPPGAVGEAYWNFHLPGVLVVFFLLGVFKRWLANLLSAYPRAPAIMVIYMICLFYFDGSQNGFRIWLYSMVPALVILWLGGMIRLPGVPARVISPLVRPRSHAA
ncbi:MAG TPA: O-antigen polymerase [Methylomirabilota bacterium]|nr:O-antigen polymerase [Methylomirabilota bacterium]